MTPSTCAPSLARVKDLLARHAEATGSTVARHLLGLDDSDLLDRFTAVIPRDYARVLAARADAEAAGLGEAETTAKMMEAAHG